MMLKRHACMLTYVQRLHTKNIHEQSSSGMSDLLFAEKVGSPSYVVPIDYSAYENIDF